MHSAFLLAMMMVAQAEVLTTGQLEARLEELAGQTQADVLLGAVGSDAELDLKRWLKKNPGTPAVLVRVATLGQVEEEMRLALERAGLGCGLRATPNGGIWEVTTHGRCAPDAGAVEEPAPTAPPRSAEPARPADLPAAAESSGGATTAHSGDCFPPCSPGYFCHEGACLEACNPPCGEGHRCTEDRICVSEGTPAATAEPAGQGKICLYRERKLGTPMAAWAVNIEGRRQGTIAGGEYLCFTAEAGSHQLAVVSTAATGWGTVPGGDGFGLATFTVRDPLQTQRTVSVSDGGTQHYRVEMITELTRTTIQLRGISGSDATRLKRELQPGAR